MKIQFKNLAVGSSLLTIIVLLLAACGNSDKNKEDMPENGNITTEKVAELEAPAASGISFKDKDGKIVSLNTLKGKVVFINFWATWCPPCIEEMPSINKLKQSFKDNEEIVFLMVDVDNKMEKSTAFMVKNNYDLPVYVHNGNIPAEYLGSSIPTTVILDKSGDMIVRIEGGRDYTSPEMVKVLNELVESK